jgi:DNA-3-methyladenine glycosylase
MADKIRRCYSHFIDNNNSNINVFNYINHAFNSDKCYSSPFRNGKSNHELKAKGRSMKKLSRTFYERNTLEVTKELLGKYLIHKSLEGMTIGRIVEVEAYIGPHDPASHAYKGLRSKRTEVQFGPGGYAYVYQIYGMYFCFNVVTQKKGKPEVVLVRALEPIKGLGIMAKRRKFMELTPKNMINLTNGPSKLCEAMGITEELYGEDLCGDRLYIADNNEKILQKDIKSTPRINIDYAGETKEYPWRFVIADNEYVSVRN